MASGPHNPSGPAILGRTCRSATKARLLEVPYRIGGVLTGMAGKPDVPDGAARSQCGWAPVFWNSFIA